MKKNLLILILVCFAFANIYSQNSSSSESYGLDKSEVFLPVSGINTPPLKLVDNTSDNFKYKKFIKKYGNWTFLIDTRTGLIHRAFGQAIQLLGTKTVNKNNIETASIKFLKDNSDIFDIDVNTLKLTRITEVNGHWYVSYKQYYQGIQVVLSEIELRIYKNGKLSNFGMEYFPVNKINIKPNLTDEEAMQFATVGIRYDINNDNTKLDDKMYILPYTIRNRTEYKLVYKVDIETHNPIAHYFAFVDAYDGRVLWRHNTVYTANKLKVEGLIKEKFANDTFVAKPFSEQYIYIDGTQKAADKNGEIEIDLNKTANLRARFISQWVKVKIKRGHTETDYTGEIPPSQDYKLLWNDDISHKTERILFYHANFLHKFIKELDTALKEMDFQLQVSIDFGGSRPNAFSGGNFIGFVGVNVDSMRMAESPQVLYHEYGHSVNKYLYESQGVNVGMINMACNEGTADLFCSMIQDEPRMGIGVWVEDASKIIRTLDNRLVYPDDIIMEGHHDGQILGGAFWDLRKTTTLEYVRRLSHFTKYGTPDDANVGKAFSEWFLETLNADDDDGDLTNGTPNYLKIVKAFNLHQIGTNLLIKYGLEHQAYKNTLEIKKPYPIVFKLKSGTLPGVAPDSVSVIWSVDNFASKSIAIANLTDKSKGEYTALIPAQKAGSIVRYYIHLWEPLSESGIDYYSSFSGKEPYIFLVGYKRISIDNFEDSDWQVGGNYDNANRGRWENDIPNLIDLELFGLDVIQPGKGFGNNGKKCWVTGAKGTTNTCFQYMPNGRTTVTSNDIDISSTISPIIKYQKWLFTSISNIPIDGKYIWQTDLSFDEGSTWKNVENNSHSTNGWKATYILLNHYMPVDASKFRIRFRINAPKVSGQIFLNEGLFDDFEILDIDDNLISVEDKEVEEAIINVYPNPFSDKIYFTIKHSGRIKLDIFDILGHKLRTFNSNADNSNVFAWDAVDFSGQKMSSGIYFYKVYFDNKITTGKFILE